MRTPATSIFHRDRIGRAVLILSAPLILMLSAEAQKISRSEQASARLEFVGFSKAGQTIEVGPGDEVWAENARHADVATLLVELPDRKQPFTLGAPAGSILYGYRVAGGVIYCASPDPARANKEAQCLRDLDNDGTFDAAQVVEWDRPGDQAFSAWVKHLAAVSKGGYQILPRSQAALMGASIAFHDVHDGIPRFKLTVNGRTLSEPVVCKRISADVCALFGVSLQFASVGSRMRFTFQDVAPERIFDPYRLTHSK